MAGAPKEALLIEDDQEDCNLIVKFSQPFNVVWDVVHRGADALDRICSKVITGKKYNLIVMDLNLKSPPEGVELFREIKRICPCCPVLILSGYISDSVIQGIRRTGLVANFVIKPAGFTPDFFTDFFNGLNIPRKGMDAQETIIGDV